MAVLKFILIVILVWYVLKLLFRAYGPWLLEFIARKLIRKMEKDFMNRQEEVRKKDIVFENETVTVKNKPQPNDTKNFTYKNIEDIDYEEIK